jgi:hypothetical protein
MTRWSLNNIVLPVSHKQFVDLTTQFKKAAEDSFGTECKLNIIALSTIQPFTTVVYEDSLDYLDQRKKADTILETADVGAVSKALWKSAAYVEVSVDPLDKGKATASAWGQIAFKGDHPRRATFYIQPDGVDARKSVLKQNFRKLAGDGYGPQ